MRFPKTFQLAEEVLVRVVGRPLHRLLHLLRRLLRRPGVALGHVGAVFLLLCLPGAVPQGFCLEHRIATLGSGLVRRVGPRDPNPWLERLRERLVDLRPLRVP